MTWSPALSLVTPGPTSSIDAGALVAADDREAGSEVAGADVLVGVAQAGGNEPDEHLADLRGIELQLGNLPVLARRTHDCCPGLHAHSPGRVA